MTFNWHTICTELYATSLLQPATRTSSQLQTSNQKMELLWRQIFSTLRATSDNVHTTSERFQVIFDWILCLVNRPYATSNPFVADCRRAGAGAVRAVQPGGDTARVSSSAADDPSVSQLVFTITEKALIGPSHGWKCLLALSQLSHLRLY